MVELLIISPPYGPCVPPATMERALLQAAKPRTALAPAWEEDSYCVKHGFCA